MNDLVKVARIIKTHGLKGEMIIYPLTNNIETRFKINNPLIIKEKDYTIAKFSYYKEGKYILQFKELADINLIEPLLKEYIYSHKIKDENIIYINELVGFNLLDLDKKILGKVESIEKIGPTYYLLCNKKYIPLLPSVFYSLIDEENKNIYLTDKGVDCYYNA